MDPLEAFLVNDVFQRRLWEISVVDIFGVVRRIFAGRAVLPVSAVFEAFEPPDSSRGILGEIDEVRPQ